MSDLKQFPPKKNSGLDDVSRTSTKSNRKRKGGLFAGVFLQSLKWIAIIFFGVILIVTTVVITVNRLEQRSSFLQDRVQLSEEFTAEVPVLEWYSEIGDIRGSTADIITRSFVVMPHIGYDPQDKAVQTELVARTIQIREIISFYFASRTIAELKSVESRQRVKSDLTTQINRIMNSGKIRDIAFDVYQLLEF